MEPIDADFRVVGEDKWAPFRRWLAPKIADAIIWLVVFISGVGALAAMRWLQGLL